MASIFNSTEYIFSPSSQQAIQNACANAGIDEVNTELNAEDEGRGVLFDFFDEDGNYLFSIDTESDAIFDRSILA